MKLGFGLYKHMLNTDHYNFAKNNIPIIFYFTGVHKDYHRETDTADKINYDIRFYIILMNKNKNEVFAKYFDLLHGKIHWYRNISRKERPFENSINDRVEILNSIKRKDKG
jgi:DNA-binding FadR family transcriptional regulator